MQVKFTFRFQEDEITNSSYTTTKKIVTVSVSPRDAIKTLNMYRSKRLFTQAMKIYLCNGSIALDVIGIRNMTLNDVKSILFEAQELELKFENILNIAGKREMKK